MSGVIVAIGGLQYAYRKWGEVSTELSRNAEIPDMAIVSVGNSVTLPHSLEYYIYVSIPYQLHLLPVLYIHVYAAQRNETEVP